MRELTRRDALAGATALGAVALAGCVAENGDDNPDDDNGGGTGQDPELELRDTELTTTAADCGAGDMVEASVTDGDLLIEGTVPASNPCYEAVLAAATLDDGALSVVVELEDTTEEDEACPECVGAIDYEATLSFSEDLEDLSPFESFTVEHGGSSGEVHTIEEVDTVVGSTGPGGTDDGDDDNNDDSDHDDDDDGVDESQGGVVDHSIETTETNCTNEVLGDEPERIEADDEVEFTQTGDTVTVDGSLLASTPCHEAYIESLSYSDGALSIVVGAESAIEDGQYCQECIGDIHYEATVSLVEGTVVDDVSMTHLQGPESESISS